MIDKDPPSHLLFLFVFVLLPLHDDEDELVVGSDQYFVFSGLETHEFEIVVGIQVSHCIFSLGHQLRHESSQGVA
jgi:hypothetical protein